LSSARRPAARPFGNVANYASAVNTATRSFAANGVDVDINGRAMGTNPSNAIIGNAPLAGMTTTVTLNYLDPAQDATVDRGLGPNGAGFSPTPTTCRPARHCHHHLRRRCQ
jgi:hypothetical protein